MRELVLVLNILGFLSLCVGQIVQNGQCDNDIVLASNFDIDSFLGTWYEIRRGANPVQGGDCSSMQFARNNESITYHNKALNKNFVEELRGTITYDGPKLTLNITDGGVTTPLDLWVLSVDYELYALVYRCENISTTQRQIYLWQLGRETGTPPGLVDVFITNTLNNLFNMSVNDLVQVDSSEKACFELPIIASNQPVIIPGQCDENLKGVANFNASAFTGEWHEIASYYSENSVGSCPRAEYSLEGTTVNVVNSEVIDKALRVIKGTATVDSDDGSAKLKVILEVLPGLNAEQTLYILATDYVNYAVSYTCENVNTETKRVYSWVASRTRELTAAAQEEVNKVIDEYLELNEAYFQNSARTDEDCFYYPDPEPGKVVTFRGTCNLSIPVVQDFDVAEYLGLWHDIASYPSMFQEGTCNNAFYSLQSAVPPVVDVFNTMVIDEKLDTINGEARPASDDGSGKLIVTFPIAPIPLNYWVLDTDYKDYALVYTCAQITEDTRNVWSWKLSRTKSLSNEAQTRINEIVNSIDVLDERYFVTKNQSAEGCFYYPEPKLGQPVIFPGQCENVTVVDNFNFSSFTGIWHEIEAYPKDDQPSQQCINHAWTLGSGNDFTLISSSIVNQFLRETNSTSSSSDGSARMTITLNNQNVEIPFWIIDTDYTDFALAYSCVNLEDRPDYRAVYSWKLSRSKSLSASAVARINTAISTINVLSNDYYEPIGQTDDDCFYLPELAPGAPIILPGQCGSNIDVMTSFDAARYLGKWHMIETYPSTFQLGQCNDATYTLNQTDNSVIVFNTEVNNEELFTITGRATIIPSTDGSAKLLVTFPDAPFPIEYWVLDTDYDTFSFVYSCVNISANERQVWSWKLSRTKSLTTEANTKINEIISKVNVLNSQYYQVVDNSDEACFYYPEPNGNSVTFRGLCNESIPTVQNFDATRYMGQWYDIQSYPSVFQEGSCNSAFYTLNTVPTVSVDVYNTQVVNQTLDEIYGVAVPASDTGEAKLLVTFATAPIPVNYWVLDTDYDSYALVYTCTNTGPDSRLVFSWKLSRTRTLSQTAQNNINNAISSIPVLDQRYFVAKDHSDEGCFYFPEPRQGQPVVFPGTCDANLPVVTNLDLARFLGTWYEIETYPKEFAPGQCISHSYTAGSTDTMNLATSAVDGESLRISQSNVTAPADGSAKLNISIANGVSIPFWIIDTDYDDFALAYSCVDLTDRPGFRGVYSWKLSRSKTLSASAVARINTAISTINVLSNDYFEPVGQTDDDCFYLPELAPGESVIFPGQCGSNIDVMTGFDAARYLGKWHMIETYPSTFQLGQCNDATYTLNQTDNSVIVFNTEVINEELSTITGRATIIPSTDGSAKLLVTFPDAPFPIEYWVLDTDYDTFSFVYSCVNISANERQVWSWKLSRTKSLTTEANTKINEIISKVNVLNSRYYQIVNNSDEACFYYPEPNGNSVTFRGLCNESIPTVQNFDATRYMGQWYDIQSYPSVFQEGSCNSAFYTLNTVPTVSVDVYNTQVVNQTLDEIYGVAVPASDTGEAKLLVTFPNAPIPVNYWVLDTDYDSYALVYTCTNTGPDSRLVFSWKLSRTRTLSQTAQNNINTTMNSIPVLDQRYFVAKDHSDEGCFYFPEPRQGQPVVFPGTCDANLPVVTNLDLARFLGTWYEIETYPKEFAPGQCISHSYTAGSANTMNLATSAVNGQSLQISQSNVTAPDDGSGKLTISIANGISIPFWIIDTNYDDYALAYSCIDLADQPGFRGVYSWKLSRTKSLSNTSLTNITNAIQSIDVLDEMYFESVDQTDAGCFYYPELNANDPVVFVGQCAANINAMSNFSAERFSGRWFDIESYYDDDYQGSCVDGRFNLNSSNNGYNVEFSQVVNESLISTTSSAIIAADGTGKLSVTTNIGTFEFLVLATDYDNYALIYSCSNVNETARRVRSWKMSRTRQLTTASSNQIATVIASIDVLDERYYNMRDHSREACFYFPTPVPGQPRIFRGECNETYAVVQEFDVTAYLGTWYEIESYPNEFQGGSCSTARYSLSEFLPGVVSVNNTQVVDQRLETANGTAVVASDDGSAKLSVSFPIPGTDRETNTPYWVLTTDYTNYALVYSCNQIDDEYYRIGSWKLSRERTLSAQAQTQINNATNNVRELRQEYYEESGHSDEDCFYYPEFYGGPIILPGTCPNTEDVDVVTNFDASRFAGPWYEVARFPSNLLQAECASLGLELNGTNLDLTARAVKDQELYISETQLTALTEGQAVFRASLSSLVLDLHILDTDYDEYALVYSCRDLGDNQKQIYSWKLSKSKSGLSEAANEKIKQIIGDTPDLFEGYYETTDQSNDACFYYPKFEETPEAIVMPGPCPNVTAVPDFQAANYLGRWFEIARFPQRDQSGTCSQAEYEAGINQVDVRNTEVVDRKLDVQIGSAVVKSDDGSGILGVTFNVNGVEMQADYYVLATDYESYSLVYNCRDRDDGYMEVYSWKLSRQRELSSEANTIIDKKIEDTKGLLEEYYLPTSQTDEDCFYIPEFDETKAPVFRGTCDESIKIDDFDKERFLGWWHQIERYPLDTNIGECISSRYQESGESIEVTDTHVTNVNNATINKYTVTIDDTGKVERRLENEIIQTYQVLETDYTSYALVYSCEGIQNKYGDPYRRIWSAKYSRTPELPQVPAIDARVEAIDVLEDQFYIDVAQTDEACFHYSDQLVGGRVVLRGQCDENIPVEQNFSLEEFTGTWYQMERYPYPQISDKNSCIGTRYTITNATTNELFVLNWEVNEDNELVTINGTAFLASDGSGRFTITYPYESDDEATLHILKTDYTSYAVALTCETLNEFERALVAIKLSRTRTMPDSATAAIDTLIGERPELHQPYFIQISHNDECEEPSSGYFIRSSIIVMLICAVWQLLVNA